MPLGHNEATPPAEDGLNRQWTLKSIGPVVFGPGVQDNVVLSNLRSLREKIRPLMGSRCHQELILVVGFGYVASVSLLLRAR